MPPRVSRCIWYGQRRRSNQRGWDKKKSACKTRQWVRFHPFAGIVPPSFRFRGKKNEKRKRGVGVPFRVPFSEEKMKNDETRRLIGDRK